MIWWNKKNKQNKLPNYHQHQVKVASLRRQRLTFKCCSADGRWDGSANQVAFTGGTWNQAALLMGCEIDCCWCAVELIDDADDWWWAGGVAVGTWQSCESWAWRDLEVFLFIFYFFNTKPIRFASSNQTESKLKINFDSVQPNPNAHPS